MNSVGLCFCFRGAGFKHDLIKASSIVLFPDLLKITIGPCHEPIEHFRNINFGAKRAIDRRHLQTNDAAANHEHALGNAL